MASQKYPLGKQAIYNGEIDLEDDEIRVAGVTSGYTYSDAHQFKSSVPSYTGSTDTALSGKTTALGVFDANNMTPWNSTLAIDGGSNDIVAWVIFKWSGADATSPLIAYIDISGNPITPNGGDINITWDNGTNKIFRM